MANIKNEFSAIKQSPGSMMEEDSFNNSGFMNPSYQQQNIFNMNMNNGPSKISNYSTVSNTNIMVNNKNISNSNINNSIKKNVNVGNNNNNYNNNNLKKKPLVAPSGPSVTVNNNKQNIISKGINKTSSKKTINKK